MNALRSAAKRPWLVWSSRLVALGAAAFVSWTVPFRLCARRADAYFDGDASAHRALADSAARWLESDPASLEFHTGSERFDGEWFLIVHMAAALGFTQSALEHPEWIGEFRAHARRSIDRLLLPRGRAHDTAGWHEDAMASLGGGQGHLAYLAYANLALSVHRQLEPDSPFATHNAAITEALTKKFADSPTPLLESYPNETYPADNAVALASIVVFDRVTGTDHRPHTARALEALRTTAVDARSGLLFQRVGASPDDHVDAARASGTAMAALAFGYASLALARPYWEALRRQYDTILGFGGIREYPEGAVGRGDVDSGPILFGMSVSASGFALASARRFGDRERYRALFASAWLLGLPTELSGSLHFVTGGPLGDVLLFALSTAHGAP